MALDDIALPEDFVQTATITDLALTLQECCHHRVHAPRGFGKTTLKRFVHDQVSDRAMSLLINFDQQTQNPIHEIFFCLQADAWRLVKQDPNAFLPRLTQAKWEYGLGLTKMLVSEHLKRVRRSFDEEMDKLRLYCEDSNLKKLEYFRAAKLYDGNVEDLDISHLMDYLREWQLIAYGADDSYLWIDIEKGFNWIKYGQNLLMLLNDRQVSRSKNPLIKLFLSTVDMNRHLKDLGSEYEEVDLKNKYDLNTLMQIASQPIQKRHGQSIHHLLGDKWIQHLHQGLPHLPNCVVDHSPKAWRDIGDLLSRLHAEMSVSLQTEEDWKQLIKQYFEAHIKLQIEDFKGEIHVWVGNREVKLRSALLETLLNLANGTLLNASLYPYASKNSPYAQASALRAAIEPLHDSTPSSNKHRNDPFHIFVVANVRGEGPQLLNIDDQRKRK